MRVTTKTNRTILREKHTDEPYRSNRQPKKMTRKKILLTGLLAAGATLNSCNGYVYACLPFDNRICKIRGGKILETYTVNFGAPDAAVRKDNLGRKAFLRRNNDTHWMITNIAASDSLIVFNTNMPHAFVVNTNTGQGVAHGRFGMDILPFATSRWIPGSGSDNSIAQEVSQKTVKWFVEHGKGNNISKADSIWNKITDSKELSRNPVIVLYRLR